AVSSLNFFKHGLTPFQADQSYHSIYFTFSGLPKQGPSWTLNKINLGLQLNGSSSTSYVIFQLNGTSSQSTGVFHFSPSIASYEYTLYPNGNARIFPDDLPPADDYAIVIISLTGVLDQVRLLSVYFVFTQVQDSSQISISSIGQYWYLY